MITRARFVVFALLAVVLSIRAHAYNYHAITGEVIAHLPTGGARYIGSPSFAVLPNGDYVASHDWFGGNSGSATSGITKVYGSSDGGTTWSLKATVTDMWVADIFYYGDSLYLLGNKNSGGDIVIRRSTNGGTTWGPSVTLFSGSYGGRAPSPALVHDGRIWSAFGRQVVSLALTGSPTQDLTAGTWDITNLVAKDPTWLGGAITGSVTESNLVEAPDGSLKDVCKVGYFVYGDERMGVFDVNSSTSLSINATTPFPRLDGARIKFAIRRASDGVYWAMTSYIHPEDQNNPDFSLTRNTLALFRSTDMVNWTFRGILLRRADPDRYGFQYPYFTFDPARPGSLLFVVRTSFPMTGDVPYNGHDANLLTFHRLDDYANFTTAPDAFTNVAAQWDPQGFSSSNPWPTVFNPTATNPDAVATGLTLGSGLSLTMVNDAWGSGNSFNTTTKDAAITAGQYISFALQADSGKMISLSNLDLNVRLTSGAYSAGVNYIWQYRLGGTGSFADIGSSQLISPALGTYSTNGVHMPTGLLCGIDALQSVSDMIEFRLVSWSSAVSNYAFNFGRLNPANDLYLRGTVEDLPYDGPILFAWDPQGFNSSTPWTTTFAPVVTGEQIETIAPLTLGSGLTLTNVNDAWGSGSNFNQTNEADAITAGQYFTFSVAPKPGFRVSLDNLDLNVRLTSATYAAGVYYVWQYRIGSGAFVDAHTPQLISAASTGTYSTNGNAMPTLDLSVISVLQSATGTIEFRLVSWSTTTSGYAFTIGRVNPANDLALGGWVSPTP